MVKKLSKIKQKSASKKLTLQGFLGMGFDIEHLLFFHGSSWLPVFHVTKNPCS